MGMALAQIPGRYAVCRLPPGSDLPRWLMSARFACLVRTSDELSVVTEQENVPDDIQAVSGWTVLKVRGPLDFSLTGVLSDLSSPLADAEIAIFAVSTYDTDYLLLREHELSRAAAVLREAGHDVELQPDGGNGRPA